MYWAYESRTNDKKRAEGNLYLTATFVTYWAYDSRTNDKKRVEGNLYLRATGHINPELMIRKEQKEIYTSEQHS